MQVINKAETFVGFSVRSGKILFGYEQIERSKRVPKLIVLCSTLGANSQKKIVTFAEQKHVKVLKLTQRKLEDVVHKSNCKIIGLMDEHLAQAVIDNSQDWAICPKGGVING